MSRWVQNRSSAALLAVLATGLLAGCEEKPAAGTTAAADPCQESCTQYAQCSLDLSKNMIRTILEGSGDDVRKTAFDYAAEDAKQVAAQCKEQCSGAAKDKIAKCRKKATCVKKLACMAEALPVEKEADKGPHACKVDALSQCVEYTGGELKTSDVKSSCRALFEGKYSKEKCSQDDLVGSCKVGDKTVRSTFYYSKGKKPHTAESAKEACVGTFTAAAGSPASTGSAAASAAPTASASAPPK